MTAYALTEQKSGPQLSELSQKGNFQTTITVLKKINTVKDFCRFEIKTTIFSDGKKFSFKNEN